MTNVVILRRPKLGRTSCREIARYINAHNQSLNVTVHRNDRKVKVSNPDALIRWGTTSTSGMSTGTVYNTSQAIHQVNDKAGFRKYLREHAPDIIPRTVFDGEETAFTLPHIIIRPRNHAQGKHTYLIENGVGLLDAIAKCGDGWYASEYIPKVAEYRVMFVQGRVAWVANKIPSNPDAVCWNVAKGGKFENVAWSDWPLRAVKVARQAFMLTDLDFGAVDVMVDADGKPYVLEINSAPSQTSPYRQEATAKCFAAMLTSHFKNYDISEKKGDWKKFIHPALSDKAWVE